MANGWTGSSDEWRRLQEPLLTLDAILAAFAERHKAQISKNGRGDPERSLRWGDNPSCLIQIYLEDEVEPTWNLWVCCSEDRESDRYWRNEFAIRGKPVEQFRDGLASLLEESF